MGAGEFFALIMGLWWVLLVLFIIVSGVYGLVHYLQRKLPKSLKRVPQHIHHIQTECRRIISETRSYSPDDPLPYGPLVAGIHRQLDVIANQLVPLRSNYVDIQNREHALRLRPWKILLGAPIYLYKWYGIRKDTLQILQEFDELHKLVGLAWQDIGELKKQAWLVASKSREVVAREKEIRRLLDHLGNQKLYGDTFDLVATQEESVIEALERIPDYFLLADEETIAKLSTKEAVCEVYALLNQSDPVLDDLRDKLSLWTAEHRRLSEKAFQVQQQMELVEHLLESKPEVIDVTDEAGRVQAVRATMDVLSETLSRLEVESIALIDQELDRSQKLISEIGRGVRIALRQYPSLKALMDEILNRQKDCSDKFAELIKRTHYPILWEQSNQEFIELNKAVNDLGPLDKARNLEQLDKDVTLVEALSLRWAKLQATLNEVAAQHQNLLDILVSEEVQQGLDWIEEYRLLVERIAAYHPDNWPKAEAVANFADDVQKIEAHHRLVRGWASAKNIPESALPTWIAEADKLVQDHKNMRLRSEKIRERLKWLKSEEEKAREIYQGARSVVNQLSWIANSNVFLGQIADADLQRINQSLERSRVELEQTTAGLVEKKTRLIESDHKEIVQTARKWLERLNREIDRRCVILTEKTDHLSEIAKLEDPVFDKVRRTLLKEERTKIPDDSAPFIASSPGEIILELKGRSIIWQELVAAQEELEEIVEIPLLDSFRHANEQRQKTLSALDRAMEKIAEHPSWPPCSVSIVQEKMDLEKLEGERKALKSAPLRAIWAVRQYGELAARYQVLEGKISSSFQWAVQEQERVLQLEKEIELLLKNWNQRGQRYTRDPHVMEQIRDLRARATLALDHLKQKWISASPGSGGSLTYQELVQNILDISRFLKTTNITVQGRDGEVFELYLEETQQRRNFVDR
jgi:hypothetical protein